MKDLLDGITAEVATVLSQVDEEEAAHFANRIRQAKRIFVCGEGRSGLMAKAFAMRLMHGGKSVYVVGETITPGMETGDTLIVISGSGRTGSLLYIADQAVQEGAEVVVVTTDPHSPLGGLAHFTCEVPAATKYRRSGRYTSMQPMGNAFDQAAHLLLDAIVIQALHVDEALQRKMEEKHANLE